MSAASRAGEGGSPSPVELTTLHVRRAREGDAESLEWIVERFSAVIIASARYRIAPIRHLYDPEDIVNDVWAVLLPKLAHLEARDGRYTPVLMRFIGTTVIHRVNTLLQKHIIGKPRRVRGAASEDGDGGEPLDRLPDRVTGIVTRILREERRSAVLASIERLSTEDRELIILRGIEQHPYKEIAAVTGGDPKVLAVQYSRALAKLRRELPDSVFAEFGEE